MAEVDKRWQHVKANTLALYDGPAIAPEYISVWERIARTLQITVAESAKSRLLPHGHSSDEERYATKVTKI